MANSVRVEYASERKFRARNKVIYRLSHWPIWIGVFFLAPGPLTSRLFAQGFDGEMRWWLALVLLGTGVAGLFGQLPGVEPKPYILRFTEDRPNPLYRRICYTLAWSELITYAVLNLTGLLVAAITGKWILRSIYDLAYFPLAGSVWALGALGRLPRVMPSTKGEGTERRYFYGTLWAVAAAQPLVGLLWVTLPLNGITTWVKLLVFIGVLAFMGRLAMRGLLPRTREILPGELMVSD